MKKPATTPGNSTRSATSSTSAACSLSWHPAAQPAGVQLEIARDPVAALGVLEHDEVLGQPGRYSSKLRTLIERPARPLVARKRWP